MATLQDQLEGWRVIREYERKRGLPVFLSYIDITPAHEEADPLVLLAHLEEKLLNGDVSADELRAFAEGYFTRTLPTGGFKKVMEQTKIQTAVAAFFDTVDTHTTTKRAALRSITNAALYNILFTLYRQEFFAALTSTRDGDAVLPSIDLRNALDENAREGQATNEVVQNQQDMDAARAQQMRNTVNLYVAAMRELSQMGMIAAATPPEKMYKLARDGAAQPDRRNYAKLQAATSAYYKAGSENLDEMYRKEHARNITKYEEHTPAVFAALQTAIDAVEDTVTVEEEFALQPAIRQHAMVIKTVEELLSSRARETQLGVWGKQSVEESQANIVLLVECALHIDDLADALVRDSKAQIDLAMSTGRGLRQYKGEVSAELTQLRKDLRKPKRTIVKHPTTAPVSDDPTALSEQAA